MTALDWLRSKSEVIANETFEVEGKLVKSVTYGFKGFLPNTMVPQIKKQLNDLIDEDMVVENIVLGDGNRYGYCEYTKNTYEFS